MPRARAKAYPAPGGGRGGPFPFRNADDPAVLPMLEEDEEKQAAMDRAWEQSIERAIGAESAAQLCAAIRELNPADAHALLRGASLEPLEGNGYLPAASRRPRALPGARLEALPPPPPLDASGEGDEGTDDEAAFWAALDAYRDGETTAIEVDRILSRPALRRRADLRADFDRLLRIKG